jgi:hypothetical protein
MKRVFRIILIGLAICTVAVPDMGAEFFRRVKSYVRDLKDKTTDGIQNMAKGFSKSSTEKTR